MLFDFPRGLLLLKAGTGRLVEDTATGNPLTFNTNVAKPLKSLLIPFTPTQSGTGDPAPDNVRPISGWTGVNVQSSGENVLNSTAPTIIDVSGQGVNRYGQVFRSAGKYTIVNNSESYDYLYFKKVKNDLSSYGGANKVNHGQNAKITLEENYMLYVYKQAGSDMSDFCVNIGEDAVFHAYTGQTYTVTWSDSGTVYGGTLDLVTGVLSVTHVLWTKNTAAMNNDADYPGWKNAGIKSLVGAEKGGAISAMLNVGNVFAVNTRGINDIVYLPKGEYNNMTQDDWIELAIDVQVAVPIATPQEIQLTPEQITALVGDNTIWSDTNGENVAVYIKKA